MRIVATLVIAVCWLVATWSALAGELVVIESTESTLKPGQIVDASAALTLPSGVHLKLLAEDGTVTNLKGPFSGLPPVAGTPGGVTKIKADGLVKALSRLMVGDAAGNQVLGVIRGGSMTKTTVIDLWAVDVQRSGDYCVLANAVPNVSRSKRHKSVTLTLKTLPDDVKVSVRWPVGRNRMAWPEKMPLTDGGRYLAKLSDRSTVSKLMIHLVPVLPSDAHRVVWMAERGCSRQARALLARLH